MNAVTTRRKELLEKAAIWQAESGKISKQMLDAVRAVPFDKNKLNQLFDRSNELSREYAGVFKELVELDRDA